MAIIQSLVAAGVVQAPDSYSNGIGAGYLASIELPAGTDVAAGDVIELGVLPADHRLVTMQLIPEGDFGGATADVGLMSGEVGSTDPARTVGNEFFEAQALTAFSSLSKGDGLLIEPTDAPRSIGVKLSAAVTGAGQKLTAQIIVANAN
jgi:hypothetical protein